MKGETSPRVELRILPALEFAKIWGSSTIKRGMWQGLTGAIGAIALVAGVFAGGMGTAQSLIRDAEIERTLKQIAAPVLQAAGMGTASVDIYIVNSNELNAFVAGGNNIFLNTGLLRRLDTIDQLQAVIAHETGHITGGHLARRDQKLRSVRGVALLGLLAGAAAAASGQGDIAAASAGLSAEVARRELLAHSRSEESAADQASVRYMVGAGADPEAILEVMELFRGQEILSNSRQDAYVRTHPMWSDRIRHLEDRIANAGRPRGRAEGLDYWHRRMVAKFDGFIGNPSQVIRRYDGNSETDVLARAVAYHRIPKIDAAMKSVDALIAARPNDPFYHELKGQFLIENGQPGAAVASYRRAVSLASNEPLLLAGLGRALVATGDAGAMREAIGILEKSRQLDPANARALRDLGRAYATTGNPGQAALVTAEAHALSGSFRDATIFAKRAQGLLPNGSPGWRRAQDILNAAERAG